MILIYINNFILFLLTMVLFFNIHSMNCYVKRFNQRKLLIRAMNINSISNSKLSSTIVNSDNISKVIESSSNTGAFFHYLPKRINPPDIHYKQASRATYNTIKMDKNIKNLRQAHRKYGAQTFDLLMKYLNVPLTNILESYHPITILKKKLHPYEATVANLTMVARVKKGLPDLNTVLTNVKSLRVSTSRIAKDYAFRSNNAASAIEAKDLLESGKKELEELYNSNIAACLVDILEIQKDLRKIPVIELDTPTVVLVGAPNVGKSSIVRAISTGTPEVNDYPFTTRGVTIGHIINTKKDIRIQVMDTPGLLDRPAVDRNEMEKLTFASLAHLPTAVIFVIDPTGLSGEKSTLEAQLNVREYLKSRFPRRPWIDVVSKHDIDIDQETINLLPKDFLHISVKTNHNIDQLQSNVLDMVNQLIDILSSNESNQTSNIENKQELLIE